MAYSQQKYADMHHAYVFCGGDARAAGTDYKTQYPKRPKFNGYRWFQNVHSIYVDVQVPGIVYLWGRPILNSSENAIQDIVTENSFVSIHPIAIFMRLQC